MKPVTLMTLSFYSMAFCNTIHQLTIEIDQFHQKDKPGLRFIIYQLCQEMQSFCEFSLTFL